MVRPGGLHYSRRLSRPRRIPREAKPMDYRAPKGTADMLPDVARVWEHMQRTAQEMFARYGYQPVYTPIFEDTQVFARGIGQATDIVTKEMSVSYTHLTLPTIYSV